MHMQLTLSSKFQQAFNTCKYRKKSHQQFASHIRQLKNDGFCAAVGFGSEHFADSWLWVYPKDSDNTLFFTFRAREGETLGQSLLQELVSKNQ